MRLYSEIRGTCRECAREVLQPGMQEVRPQQKPGAPMNRLSLYQALRDIATGVITRALEVSGRIEVALDRLEKLANKEDA